MSEIISVENLAYTYPGMEDQPGVVVFEDMNLKVEEGTFVAILGTNGCGKSTLAKHFNSILLAPRQYPRLCPSGAIFFGFQYYPFCRLWY